MRPNDARDKQTPFILFDTQSTRFIAVRRKGVQCGEYYR